MKGDKTIHNPSLDGRSNGVQRVQPSHGRTTGPTRRSTKGQWRPEEDEVLCHAVERFNGKNWKKIAECFKDRTDVQCLHRWQKVLNPDLVKGPWSKEEDEIIVQMVHKYGAKKWSSIAQHLTGRIGKQCRERWHNHLNPSINKEAWTQEEELALIRAHQVYGNRWAELTKYLPGRSDNSIKNHWNSSVKKKLDSYIASGLLDQFQGLPLVAHQSQSTPSSSLRVQSSGDDNELKGEISECSQESAVVCFQSASDLANAAASKTDEFQWTGEPASGIRNERSSPACSSAQYYTPLEDVNYSMQEIPCQVSCSSRFVEPASGIRNERSSPASSSAQYYTPLEDVSYSMQQIPFQVGFSSRFVEHNLARDAGPSVSMDYQFNVEDGHNISLLELVQESSRLPVEVNGQMSTGPSPNKLDRILISDEECCRLLFSEPMNDAQLSNIQISEPEGISASQAFDISQPDVLGISFPSSLTADDGTLIYCTEPNQVENPSFGTEDQQFITSAQENSIYANDTSNSLCNVPTESPKLVSANSFNSQSNTVHACSSVDCRPDEHNTEHRDPGTLCYEPPRFPSLDIPFLSCDLIQSGSDSQQEYSPLGIRQLMMSSMNCITPFRLWDSPLRDNSPDALLKSAAKTFTVTPSILKKRTRDLLSPLSDRRIDKKLETSNLARDLSCLDVIFDDSGGIHKLFPTNQKKNPGSSIEDKENCSPSEKNVDKGTYPDKTKEMESEAKMKVNDDGASKTIHEPPGVLVEHNMNKLLLFSPDQVRFREGRALGSSSRTPRNRKYKSFGGLYQGVATETAESHSVLLQSVPSSAPLENTAVTVGNDVTNENSGLFGEASFKRSIDSPSAWKSPWFINSFIPGPRVDTDISIDDMGYFLTPGDRSYDALGLMKQLSEHTASAYADAVEVLGSKTPDTILKDKKRSICRNSDKENKNVSQDQQESHSQSSPNVMTECRVLDFSDCGTPGRGAENGKSLTGVSPSSYLLKSCR